MQFIPLNSVKNPRDFLRVNSKEMLGSRIFVWLSCLSSIVLFTAEWCFARILHIIAPRIFRLFADKIIVFDGVRNLDPTEAREHRLGVDALKSAVVSMYQKTKCVAAVGQAPPRVPVVVAREGSNIPTSLRGKTEIMLPDLQKTARPLVINFGSCS